MLKILLLPFKLILKILGFLLGKLFGWVGPIKKNMTGEDFEEYCAHLLKHLGYKKVSLTSKNDYGIDLIAYKKKYKYGFQCKLYSKPVGVSAIQQVVGGSSFYDCDKLVVITNNTFTKQAKMLATTSLVELWDGEYLKSLRIKANAKALFRRKDKESQFTHPYLELLIKLLDEPMVNVDILQKYYPYSDDKADYLLEDLEYLGLVGPADNYGMRDRLYESMDEAISILQQNEL